MANLVFPQLSSGAMAQYPIRKRMFIRTIKNVLADGSMLVAQDLGSRQIVWTLNYQHLTGDEVQYLQDHFEACSGQLRSFLYLDPTDNLLSYSADLTQPCWAIGAGLLLESGVADPNGGTSAFRITNSSAVVQSIAQTVAGPAGFQYCFSVYVASASGETLTLTRSNVNGGQSTFFKAAPNWLRAVSSGSLPGDELGLTVAVSLEPAQTISVFGPQLEPQFEPSQFRSTFSSAGLYPNAHWAVPELIFTPDGPNSFSTSFSIETSTRG